MRSFMEREEALSDFLKGFHIVFSNASAYPKDHPYFIKSLENFKERIDTLFEFLNPIRIDVAIDSLFIDGRKWEKQALYVELARIFHQRKIRSIELKRGSTITELIDFFHAVSLPQKEILRQKGIKNILNREESLHIKVEELDYSQILGTEGEELKDVWAYLFKEAIEKKDAQRINEFADNFDKALEKIRVGDLLGNEELRKSLCSFFTYLKYNQKEKFYKCSKEMFKFVSKYKYAIQDKNFAGIKSLFEDLSNDDFAGLLWDEISEDDSFDILSFRLFSQIAGIKREKEISSSLSGKISKESLKNNPKAIKRTQDLLSVSLEQSVSDVYRNTLSALLKDISFDRSVFFDRSLLYENYLFTLLNLLTDEKNKERLKLILERLSKELEGLIRERGFKYLKSLLDILNKREKEDPSLKDFSAELENKISEFAESTVWEEESSADLENLVDSLEKTSFNAEFYLDKIFREGKVNPGMLKLFFRFFSADSPLFYKNLEKKYSDLEFLGKIMESLSGLSPLLSCEILKYIFSFANDIIKMEALKAMNGLAEFDTEFIFSVLQKGNISLRRESLVILAKEPDLIKRALENLLRVSSPLGRRNKAILENIGIIEDLGFKEAEEYLVLLSKRHFFWNRNIRKRAREALRKSNVRGH